MGKSSRSKPRTEYYLVLVLIAVALLLIALGDWLYGILVLVVLGALLGTGVWSAQLGQTGRAPQVPEEI